MRIAIEAERLSGPPNGPQRYLEQLCAALLDLDPDLELIGFQFSDEEHSLFERARVEKVVLPKLPGFCERRLEELDADILHLGEGLHRYPFIFSMSTPTVATIHGIEPVIADDFKIPLRARIQKQWVWPQICRGLDAIITVSESAKTQLVANYPVEKEAVRSIYNGIDHDFYAPPPDGRVARVLERYDLERSYYLAVSGYSDRKNPKTLISSFARAARELPDQSLVIVGSGWHNRTVDEFVDQFGASGRIRRLGVVPESDLPCLYGGATGLVSTSRHENFGLPFVESMACGTPVIAPKIYAIPEVTDDAAVLIDDPEDSDGFASAMVSLARDPSVRERHRRKGLKQAKCFSWERCAREVLTLYESVQE